MPISFRYSLALVGALAVASSAHAGVDPPPIGATEQIGPVLVTSGQPLGLFFPNHFDLHHPKDLIFRGTFANQSTFAPAFGEFWFDWFDPAKGAFATSPPVSIDLQPGETQAYGLPGSNLPGITFQIPFCPPRVSIHFQLVAGPNGPNTGGGVLGGDPIPVSEVLVRGEFTHICRVPEPSSMLLAGLAVLGLVGIARRRK